MKFIKTTFESISTWPPDCYSDEEITCDCSENSDFICNIDDGLNYIYIEFSSNLRNLVVLCSIFSEININFLLDHKFQSIFFKTRYLNVIDCKNFTHEIYMNGDVQEIIVEMHELNKIILINNNDLDAGTMEYYGSVMNIVHLQLNIKSNHNEIREADVISIPADTFSTLNKLETLKLSVHSLRSQYLSLQNLTQTHFKNLTALRQLDLAGNNMRMLGANNFAGLTQLNCLNLSRNEIRELPESLFEYQPQLLVLDLSHNLLEYLPPHIFDHTPWLWQLILGGNQLHDTTNLIENLKPLHYLHRLDVSQNHLQSIWSTETAVNRTPSLLTNFRYSHKRMSLVLANGLNYITKLQPENYEGGRINSTVINLSGNRLREITLDWLVAANISCPFEINLEHNRIENIFALQNFFSATADCAPEIKMTGNPIVCDCKLAWIYSENCRSLFNGLQCVQTSTKLVKDLAQLERKELCAWEPVMCPSKCNCYTQFEFVHISCNGAQHIEELPRPEQVGLKSSVLDLSNNNFIVLPLNTTFGYA
ncbi:leucine-rich repeat-containing protein 15-like [Bactrocera dorsalis]|uniref:Leucine-rich repeat-containing protein 15-like n=1 Tax=Bactrocera dorsalis TaxID=27457 RepID=A0ABM3J0V0_BACDO|nr:leucine-rich repeat-containing protein 15-like [Bactrocera dorsalis]